MPQPLSCIQMLLSHGASGASAEVATADCAHEQKGFADHFSKESPIDELLHQTYFPEEGHIAAADSRALRCNESCNVNGSGNDQSEQPSPPQHPSLRTEVAAVLASDTLLNVPMCPIWNNGLDGPSHINSDIYTSNNQKQMAWPTSAHPHYKVNVSAPYLFAGCSDTNPDAIVP